MTGHESAAVQLGPHLLGRRHAPDERDWPLEKLLAIVEPGEDTLGKTVQQLIDEGTFADWRHLLVFWRWVKRHCKPTPAPTPTPTPVPPAADTPAWALSVQLDQGQTGHCVGFGWSGWADAAPVQDHYGNADGHALYYECKLIDGEPKAEDGSTVRSGALAMRKRGRLAAFAFAKNCDEIDTWLDGHGPVVVGTDWTDDMFTPDADGYVRPTGANAGGHCYVMLDRLDAEDAYLFQNSWGAGWGLNGRFKIKRSDFAALLANGGEACCAAELPQ